VEPGRDQRAGADSPESPTGAPESPGAAGEHVAAGEHGRPADPDPPARRDAPAAQLHPLDDPEFVAGLRTVPSTASGEHVTWSASDLSGTRPDGSTVEIGLDSLDRATLLVFLTTRCDGCETFWRGLADRSDPLLETLVTIVAVKASDAADIDEVRALAEPLTATEVVLGDRAWSDYRVTGYPFLVLVDPSTRTVLAETVGFGWSDVAATVAIGLGSGT